MGKGSTGQAQKQGKEVETLSQGTKIQRAHTKR